MLARNKRNESHLPSYTIDDIDDQDTSTSSVPWYGLMWNYCVNATVELKNVLSQIPTLFFPDNPANKDVLSWIGLSGWPAEILKAIGPIGLFFQWKNTVHSFIKLGEADNRNFIRYKEAGINLLTSLAWTFITMATLMSATALLIKTAPYILTVLFGLGAINGLVNFSLNIYYAITASTKALRNDYLIKAAKSLLSIITNTLAFVVSFYLNFKVLDAAASLNEHFFIAIKAIGDAFVTSANVLTALTVCTAVSLTMATHQLNLSTWQSITNPKKALNDIKEILLNNPLKIIPMAINFVVRVAALAFAPLHIIYNGLGKLIKKHEEEKTTVAVIPSPLEDKELTNRTTDKISLLKKQLGKEKTTTVHSSHFKLLPDISRSRIAKKDLLERLQKNEEPAEKIILEVKKAEPSVFYSFWARKGEVQLLAEDYVKRGNTLIK